MIIIRGDSYCTASPGDVTVCAGPTALRYSGEAGGKLVGKKSAVAHSNQSGLWFHFIFKRSVEMGIVSDWLPGATPLLLHVMDPAPPLVLVFCSYNGSEYWK